MTRTSRLRKRTNKEKSAQKVKKSLFLADSTNKTADFTVDTDTKNHYFDKLSDDSEQNNSFYAENGEHDAVSADSITQIHRMVRA